MAGIGRSDDRFSPGGAQEVSVQGPGFQLGKMKPPVSLPSVLGDAPAAITKPSQMAQGGPRGAQTIPVVGMSPGNQGIQMAGRARAPIPDAAPLRLPAPQAQAPQRLIPPAPPEPAPQQFALGEGEEARSFEIRGLAPNGVEYAVRFDTVFPSRTKLLGVTEITGT